MNLSRLSIVLKFNDFTALVAVPWLTIVLSPPTIPSPHYCGCGLTVVVLRQSLVTLLWHLCSRRISRPTPVIVVLGSVPTAVLLRVLDIHKKIGRMIQNQENGPRKTKMCWSVIDHKSTCILYQFLHRKSCRINVSVFFRNLVSRGQMNLEKMLGIIQNGKDSAKMRGSMICLI